MEGKRWFESHSNQGLLGMALVALAMVWCPQLGVVLPEGLLESLLIACAARAGLGVRRAMGGIKGKGDAEVAE